MRAILPYTENPALREISKEIPLSEIGGTSLCELIRDMKHLLAQEKYGVAIAAPQVGAAIRLFIVSGRALAKHGGDESDEAHGEASKSERMLPDAVYINPVMIKMSRGRKLKHEGCLSVKGKWGYVLRAEKATIRAYDEHGKLFTRGASGFLAHVFQHEMDHLDGILYIDKAKELYDDKPQDT
ncbi:peptide deformylase [Candidatus Kaiserbacteria bacterium]|nr:peptide deformylase [Candidatus Kaiserbacteria bacterium]